MSAEASPRGRRQSNTGPADRSEARYAGGMARGWESKAIESQQADAERKPIGPALSQDELDRRQRAETLGLALADITAQLQAACTPLHRDMLRQRMVAVEALLAEAAATGRRPND